MLGLIDLISRAGTANEVMDRMQGILSGFGFEFLCFTSLPRPRQQFEDVLLALRVPPEWLKLYLKERYVEVDPTIRHCRRTTYPFEWKTAPYDPESEPRAAEMVRRATEFGLSEGLWVPIAGKWGCEGGVWMGGGRPDLGASVRPLFHLIALYAFERVRALQRPQPVQRRTILTDREREVLTWITSGKSDWEIGEILGISKRTVEKHAFTTIRKLGAANRTHAVAIALREHVIAP